MRPRFSTNNPGYGIRGNPVGKSQLPLADIAACASGSDIQDLRVCQPGYAGIYSARMSSFRLPISDVASGRGLEKMAAPRVDGAINFVGAYTVIAAADTTVTGVRDDIIAGQAVASGLNPHSAVDEELLATLMQEPVAIPGSASGVVPASVVAFMPEQIRQDALPCCAAHKTVSTRSCAAPAPLANKAGNSHVRRAALRADGGHGRLFVHPEPHSRGVTPSAGSNGAGAFACLKYTAPLEGEALN